MTEQALSDIKVIDFTQYVSGDYCTKMLADYGADVIKIERPNIGDGTRRYGPFPNDIPNIEKSGLFLHLNTNKRSITLDLSTPDSVEVVKRLVNEADVVVESFRPGTMDSFGLGYDTLKSINPRLVYTSISNFGQTGPYRDYKSSDIIAYGMGGEMYSTGLSHREPVKLGVNVTLYHAGASAATGTMGAILGAFGSGAGQHVDVSIMETQISSIDRRMSMLLAYQYNSEITHREGPDAIGYPNGVYPCSDGYIQLAGGNAFFDRTFKMLGEPDQFSDPIWGSPEGQSDPDLKMVFEEFFLDWCMQRTKIEVWKAAQSGRVFSGPLNAVSDVLNDDHFNGRDYFEDVEHPVVGTLRHVGAPFRMAESPWSIRLPAPTLGQHNNEILSEIGYSTDDIERFKQRGVI